MAKHPGGHTLDYDVSLFLLQLFSQPLRLATGTVLFYLNINLTQPDFEKDENKKVKQTNE